MIETSPQNSRGLLGNLVVDIRLIPVDRRRRDVDNSLKSLLDARQAGGAYEDDSQIVRLTVEKFAPEAKSLRSAIFVRRVPAKLGQPGYRVCLRCDDDFYSISPGNVSAKNALVGEVACLGSCQSPEAACITTGR